MENRPYVPRGSCPCERADSFCGCAPLDSGQATERPSDSFEANVCRAALSVTPKDEIRNVARRQ